ncbi:MAG: hypothetical protein K0R01_2636, partial [Mycobacterium sp.]|nr:hypothetical protein [Mycobacterium sp.]
MRVRALARQIAVGAGIMVMLGGTGAGVAAAVPMATAESRAVDEATPTLPAEAGVTVPGGTNEGVGDVLGLGYEQVIRLNGSKLEIVDPMHRGGELRESFDVGARRKLPVPSMDPFALRYPGLADLYRITGPEFEARSEGHEASRLAVDGEHIYVSTIRGSNGAAADGAIVRKYKVERQGEARVLTEVNSRTVKGHFAITALDAFTFKDREYLAIGLNTTGVRVVRADVKVATDDDPEGGMPNYRTVNATWDGRKHGLHERDMVSAVALGTAGDDRLIVVAGRVTYEGSAIQATDLLVGEDDGNVWHHKDIWTNNHRGVEDAIFEHWEWTNLIEFGTVGPQKKPMVAISWPTRNRTSFLFPDSGITWNWTDGLAPTTAVRYFTDGEGNNRVFVRRAPAGPILGMSVNTDWEFYEDVPDGQVHFAVPGYQAWTVKLENRSRQAMAFRSYAGSSRTAGCWFGSDLKPTDRPLPKTVSTVAAGGVAGPFVTAQRTVGSNCTTEPGAMYATFAPSNAPEQAQTVKLLGDMEGMRVDQEVGAGVLTVRTEREGEFGIRLIIEDRNDAPTPVGGPTLTGTRLTPAPGSDYEPTDDVDDPTRPVFRFTVTDQRWHVPGADELTNVTLPV